MPTLIQAIMTTHEAIENCKRSGNSEWQVKHGIVLKHLFTMLPSGSGIDSGTKVEEISSERVKLSCGFHHMNEVGSYNGWTEHSIRVTPGWNGPLITIRGPNRNDILAYLHEVYDVCLTSEVLQSSDGLYHFA